MMSTRTDLPYYDAVGALQGSMRGGPVFQLREGLCPVRWG